MRKLLAIRSARLTLDSLHATVGLSGAAAMASSPGLLAAVDQHLAAIRDGLQANARPLTPIILAGYAEGIREAAYRHGWQAPQSIDWSVQDWVLVRLLAVCQIARSLPSWAGAS